ncbi:DUF3021 domain-containing protein [Solibacillus silvestris]|uniref:DUF3021 domain-containing protein n=1 Tax=Solibacillus silvestris TaxID=76853 RepID=UPI003F7ECE5A
MRNFLISCFVSVFMSYLTIAIITYNDETISWSSAELLHQFLFALLLGVMIGCANCLFSIKHWPYITVLSLHYGIVLFSVYTIGHFGDWFSLYEPTTALLLFIECTGIYMVVSLFIYISMKKDVERMNLILKQNRGDKR